MIPAYTLDPVRVHEPIGLEEAYRRMSGGVPHSPARDPLADDVRARLDDRNPRTTRDERQG
jgi:hypothetical protein